MHREFKVTNAYTMEVSFCGPSKGLHKDTHFSQKLLIVSIFISLSIDDTLCVCSNLECSLADHCQDLSISRHIKTF